MGQREFMIYLDPDKRLNRYRHYHVWENRVTSHSNADVLTISQRDTRDIVENWARVSSQV
jgi:hypothetical protein